MKKKIKYQNLSEIATKGTIYNMVSLIILKLGGLIFTVIIARLLLPELFGVYALALSIITIALTFTDLGITNTSIRYISDSLGKKNKKMGRSYGRFFIKRKLMLVLIAVVVLLGISKYLSFTIYNNPLLYYPLLFSCYLSFQNHLENFLEFSLLQERI